MRAVRYEFHQSPGLTFQFQLRRFQVADSSLQTPFLGLPHGAQIAQNGLKVFLQTMQKVFVVQPDLRFYVTAVLCTTQCTSGDQLHTETTIFNSVAAGAPKF